MTAGWIKQPWLASLRYLGAFIRSACALASASATAFRVAAATDVRDARHRRSMPAT